MISTMKKPFEFTRWSLRISLFALLMAGLAVFGLQLSIIDFQPALIGLAGTTLAGLLAIVLGLIGTLRAIKAKETRIASTLAGSTLGFLVAVPVLLAIFSWGCSSGNSSSNNSGTPPAAPDSLSALQGRMRDGGLTPTVTWSQAGLAVTRASP